MTFTEKNQNRRIGRAKVGTNLNSFREARRLRRLQPNGAFGQESIQVYNVCVVGTTGAQR